jgi:hypothetical protein
MPVRGRNKGFASPPYDGFAFIGRVFGLKRSNSFNFRTLGGSLKGKYFFKSLFLAPAVQKQKAFQWDYRKISEQPPPMA